MIDRNFFIHDWDLETRQSQRHLHNAQLPYKPPQFPHFIRQTHNNTNTRTTQHNMSIPLPYPPFQAPRYRRTISLQSLDHVLCHSDFNPIDSRPSTAASDSSFTTAFSSLEACPFRFYLPHISTVDSAVYSTNGAFACNMSEERQDVKINRVGLFYQYVPDASTEDEDVYTRDLDRVVDASPLPVSSGVCATNVDIQGSGAVVPPRELSGRRVICVAQTVDVDVGSYTAGERLGSATVVGDGGMEKKRNRLFKTEHRKAESSAEVLGMKKLLAKLRLGRLVK